MSSWFADCQCLMLPRSVPQADEKTNAWSWGILKMLKGKDERKKSIREKPKVSESDNNEGSS